jgi:hypothetical protein
LRSGLVSSAAKRRRRNFSMSGGEARLLFAVVFVSVSVQVTFVFDVTRLCRSAVDKALQLRFVDLIYWQVLKCHSALPRELGR